MFAGDASLVALSVSPLQTESSQAKGQKDASRGLRDRWTRFRHVQVERLDEVERVAAPRGADVEAEVSHTADCQAARAHGVEIDA